MNAKFSEFSELFTRPIVASLLLFLPLLIGTNLSAASGDLLWQYGNTNTIPANADLIPAIAGDGTVFLPNGRFLDALSSTGSLKWRISIPLPDNVVYGAAFRRPTIRHDGVVLLWTDDPDSVDPAISGLRAINPADGTVLWNRPWNPLRVSDSFTTTFVLDGSPTGSTNVLLRAVDHNGNLLWAVPVPASNDYLRRSAALAIGPEGHIYTSADSLSAFTQSGELLWSVSNPASLSLLVLSDDGTIYTTDGSRSYRVGATGTVTPGARLLPYSVKPTGNLIGLRQGDFTDVLSFTPNDELIWTDPFPQANVTLTFPIAGNGTTYAFVNSTLFALAENGRTNWQFTIPDPDQNLGYAVPALGPDGTVFVGARFSIENQLLDRSMLFAIAGEAAPSSNNWPLSGHDPANTSSDEKQFYATFLAPTLSRTSVVLSAEVRSRATSVTAYLQFGRTGEALNEFQTKEIPGPVQGYTLEFALTNLVSATRYDYQFILSNRTAVVETARATFETPGSGENIDLTEDALRLAVLAGGTITFKSSGTVVVTNPIPVRADTVIDASGQNVTIDGQGLSALFSVQNASMTLAGLRLVNARAIGIASSIDGLTNAQPALGGAIFLSNSTLRIQNCIFSNDVAQGGAGAAGNDITRSQPSGATGYGGALFAVQSDLTIADSLFLSCGATGGLPAAAAWFLATAADGGGALFLRDSKLQISNSVFTANSAPSHGSRSQANDGLGGAILLSNTPALIQRSSFTTNSAGSGGAILTDSELTLENSFFDSNQGFGSSSYGGSTSSFGGAISDTSTNTFVASNCTFTRNIVQGGFGGSPGGFVAAGLSEGGAIFVSPGFLALTNCVIGLNEVLPAGYLFNSLYGFATGAGVYCSNAVIDYSTIASNRLQIEPLLIDVPRLGSNIAGICAPGGTVSLHAVILSNEGTNAFGSFVDRGYNLISDNSVSATQPTTRTNIDSELGPFQIPDGVVGFFFPLSNSPALDSGDPTSFPATDVRGIERPYGPGPDIGAIEMIPAPVLSVARQGTQLVFSFDHLFSGPVILESSTDLSIWAPVTTSASGEPIQVPFPTSSHFQFYRIRQDTK